MVGEVGVYMKQTAMEIRRDSFLDDLSAQVAAVLHDLNVDAVKTEIAVAEVVTKIITTFGGQQLYIPNGHTHKSQDRALAVYEACNGRNHSDVAREFDISDRSVYRIYKRIHAQIVAQNQLDIFSNK